jgi:hypothetical protein
MAREREEGKLKPRLCLRVRVSRGSVSVSVMESDGEREGAGTRGNAATDPRFKSPIKHDLLI